MTWALLAILAAGFQTLRFLLQKKLSLDGLSAAGATYARFVFAAPIVAAATLAWRALTGATMPATGAAFWPWVLFGGATQILGTWALVSLFSQRNFAVGIAFKKTEVLQAALAGFALLGDRISLAGLGAILLGLAGIIALSLRPGTARQVQTGPAALGLASGALFALSAVAYRGALLELSGADTLLRALLTLTAVTASQTAATTAWLRFAQPGQIRRTLRAWRAGLIIGLAGAGGSLAWFAAFSLQNAAYVFAVGQVEVIFSILAGYLFFAERLSTRETAGIALVTLSILALILAG